MRSDRPSDGGRAAGPEVGQLGVATFVPGLDRFAGKAFGARLAARRAAGRAVELGEWYTFIRHGTELGTAYTDTLGDEALGTLGPWSQPGCSSGGARRPRS